VNQAKVAQRLKKSYKKLADKMKNDEKMKEFYVKLDYEKQLLVLLIYSGFSLINFLVEGQKKDKNTSKRRERV